MPSLDKFHEYREATRKLARLQKRLIDAEGELHRLAIKTEESDVTELARKLLQTEKIELGEKDQASGKRRRLKEEVRIIRAAIEIQEKEVSAVQRFCAQLLRQEIEPEHQGILAQIVEHLVALVFLNRKLMQFQDAARASAFTSFNPCWWELAGLPGDPSGGALNYVGSLVDQGYLPKENQHYQILRAEVDNLARHGGLQPKHSQPDATGKGPEQRNPDKLEAPQSKPGKSRKGKGKAEAAGDKNPGAKRTPTREEVQERVKQVEASLGDSASAPAATVEPGMDSTVPGRDDYIGRFSTGNDGDDFE